MRKVITFILLRLYCLGIDYDLTYKKDKDRANKIRKFKKSMHNFMNIRKEGPQGKTN